MKKLIFVLFVFINFSVFAQKQPAKNMAKVNLSAFTVKGYGLQYERQISKRMTVALGYSTIPKGVVAYQSEIEDAIDDSSVNVGNFKLGTSIFTPEVRFYVGKRGAFHGFYFAPYVRISTYNMEAPVEINSNPTRTIMFDGKLNNLTAGLLLGSNFKLSKSLYLDWWIIGASAGSGKGNLVAATSLSPSEQTDLKRELDELDVPFTTIQSDVNSNGATVKTTGTMFGVRGLGINLGIRF